MGLTSEDPNLKMPKKTVIQLKNINHKLLDDGFDNIKVLNAIAVNELARIQMEMSNEKFFAFVRTQTLNLIKKGVVKKNARMIGS